MGFLDRFRQDAEPEPVLPGVLPTTPNLDFGSAVEVVGESFYGGAVSAATARGREHIAVLLHEPHNEFDPKAVAVYLGTEVVGHLSKADLRRCRRPVLAAIKRDGHAAVKALLVGSDNPGVLLCADKVEPFSATGIRLALEQAGFNMPAENRAGAAVKQDGQRFRVMWVKSNGGARDSMTTKMAKALRDAGYKARKTSDDGYPVVFVSGFSHASS